MNQVLVILAVLLFVACSVDEFNAENRNYRQKVKASTDKKRPVVSKKSKDSLVDDLDEVEEEDQDHEDEDLTPEPLPDTSPSVSPSPSASPSASVSPSPLPSPAADTGLKNATVDPNDPTIAVFEIKAGTALNGAYNTVDTMVEIDLKKGFKRLRIVNKSGVAGHILHTGGIPCAHQNLNQGTPNNGFFDCIFGANAAIDPGAGMPTTYNHNGSRANSPFYLKIVN